MYYDFTFVEGLTGLRSTVAKEGLWNGSFATFVILKRVLKEDYCFECDFTEDVKNYKVIVSVPKDYSEIKREWIYEIFKYYLFCGIDLEIT